MVEEQVPDIYLAPVLRYGSRSYFGALAQLARAPALQAGGHRFESDMLHHMLNWS